MLVLLNMPPNDVEGTIDRIEGDVTTLCTEVLHRRCESSNDLNDLCSEVIDITQVLPVAQQRLSF